MGTGQIKQVTIFTVALKLFLIQAAPVIAKSMQERAQLLQEATWVENIICRDSILQRVTARWCIFIITPPTITSPLIHRPNLVEMSRAWIVLKCSNRHTRLITQQTAVAMPWQPLLTFLIKMNSNSQCRLTGQGPLEAAPRRINRRVW